MKLIRFCVPSGTHFLVLLTSVIALSFSFSSSAHTVVLSEYSLEYREDHWVLLFDQKTSQLVDAIRNTKPELKGINLNSEVFLDATASHITSNLLLTFEGKPLRLTPQHMHYGGLKFESRFLVEGLGENPDFLTMEVDSFDAHEHSIVIFRVTEGKDGYLNYFDQTNRLATFDFSAKSYVFNEVKSSGRYEFILQTILMLVLLGIVVKLFTRKKVTS